MLTPGTRIGLYEIVETLGEGGMGEVYRARDTKLNRDVAIKVLPDAFTGDPDRLARFKREAQVLASLNHPNIAHIYGLEGQAGESATSGSPAALVMELVEGPTLADKIAGSPLALDEALNIARQLADALESAHEQGIVHRDLKPANIKVREDGTVKVLDFGLAKIADVVRDFSTAGIGGGAKNALSMSPTLTSPALITGGGMILGTAAYMSPEQAAGKPVDKRADIWAFGVVVFEMLCGRPAFDGTSATEVIAEVLKSEPPWSDLPATVPDDVRQLLARCLAKKPASRLRDIGDARILIDEWLARPELLRPSAPAAAPLVDGKTRTAAHRSRWPLAIAGVSLFVAAAAFVFAWRRPDAQTAASRTWEFPMGPYNPSDDFLDGPVISPDGKMIAFGGAGIGPLRVRDVDALQARTLAGTEGADAVFWSPDSAFIGYLVPNLNESAVAVWKVPARGGAPTRICEGPPGALWAAAWLPTGEIVFDVVLGPEEAAFFTVSDRGGRPAKLPDDAAGKFAGVYPIVLPDNKWLAAGGNKVLLRAQGGGEKTIAHDDFTLAPMAYGGGYLLHQNRKADGVWATPFDPARGAFKGTPILVAPGGAHPSVSRDGTLVYKLVEPGRQELVWADRGGNVVASIGQPVEGFTNPALSPDGTTVAVVAREGRAHTLWTYDVTRGTRTRTNAARKSDIMESVAFPAWSPSGDRLAVALNWDIVVARPDSSDQPQVVAGGASVQGTPAWSQDGRTVMYSVFANGGFDLWYAPVDGSSAPQKFLATPADEGGPRFAPDGRHVAYRSNESGRSEVYVREFPSGQKVHQVSVNGGDVPRWSPRGDELFFIAGDTLMSAPVHQGADLSFGAPRALFTAAKIGADAIDYDVSRDGQRFIVVRTVTPRSRRAVVVENWLSRLTSR